MLQFIDNVQISQEDNPLVTDNAQISQESSPLVTDNFQIAQESNPLVTDTLQRTLLTHSWLNVTRFHETRMSGKQDGTILCAS